jgi:hypothetical protein
MLSLIHLVKELLSGVTSFMMSFMMRVLLEVSLWPSFDVTLTQLWPKAFHYDAKLNFSIGTMTGAGQLKADETAMCFTTQHVSAAPVTSHLLMTSSRVCWACQTTPVLLVCDTLHELTPAVWHFLIGLDLRIPGNPFNLTNQRVWYKQSGPEVEHRPLISKNLIQFSATRRGIFRGFYWSLCRSSNWWHCNYIEWNRVCRSVTCIQSSINIQGRETTVQEITRYRLI